jgi:3-carboxy-cis,cis-muconate cycloisomerase
MGRQRAHDRVYQLCRRAISAGRPLLDVLAEDAEILSHLDRDALTALLDPTNYLGLSGEMVDRVVKGKRQT